MTSLSSTTYFMTSETASSPSAQATFPEHAITVVRKKRRGPGLKKSSAHQGAESPQAENPQFGTKTSRAASLARVGLLKRPHYRASRKSRGVMRRKVSGMCEAVGLDGFRLLGQKILDLSPFGMLVAADVPVHAGQEVIVSFKIPGTAHWVDAGAKVARVIEGWRPFDPGYAMGLQFTDISLESRMRLREDLRGCPPPPPARTSAPFFRTA